MIADAIALYELLRRVYGERQIMSGLFDWDGTRIAGDSRLKINVHPFGEEGVIWYYSVEPVEDFEFVRIPVSAGGLIEDLRREPTEKNTTTEYFRYIRAVVSTDADRWNVKVRFMVIGYRPEDLLGIAKGRI